MAEAPMTPGPVPTGSAAPTAASAGTALPAAQPPWAQPSSHPSAHPSAAARPPRPGGIDRPSEGPTNAATARLVVGLKARLTAASMRRSAWLLVGTILGSLYLLGMVLFWGLSAWAYGGRAGPQGAMTPAVLVGAALTIGWWAASLATGRADATVHASRFALYPVPRTGLALGQLLSATIGLAGPITLLGLLSLSLLWRSDPAALIASLVLVPAAWILMVLGNRCLAAALEGLQRRRGFSELSSLIGFAALLAAAPAMAGLISWLAFGGADLERVVAVVAWTPWGALWAIPADVAAGAVAAAAARALVVAVTAALVWAVWSRLLERALEHSTGAVRSSGSRVRGAGILGRIPARPWAAVAARSILYWLRDPRYAASVVMVPVMLGLLWSTSEPSSQGGPLLIAGPLVAALMGFAISADVAYDHSAFSLHVLAGLSGRDDRLGRMVSLCVVGGALTAAALLLGVALTSTWHLLPGLVGVSLLGLLGGGGISSVLSARYTYPVPLPGDSPLKTPPGFTLLNIMVQFAAMLAIAAVMSLAIIPLALHMITGDTRWGWAGLAVGLAAGPALCWGGVVLGGRWLDARAPELFQQVSAHRS